MGKETQKKFQKISNDLDDYELLIRREFEFIPIIAKHVLMGYKSVEEFSGAVFSDIVYFYNRDFCYSIRKQGEMGDFCDNFSNAIKNNRSRVHNKIDEAVEKKDALEKAAENECNKSSTQNFLKAHQEFTRLYIFLWLAGLCLNQDIDLVGEEYLDKFNKVRNSGTFVSSLQNFFPEDEHENLSTLFPEEIIQQVGGDKSFDYNDFITILIHENEFSYTRNKIITEEIITKLEQRRAADKDDIDDMDQIEGTVAQEGTTTGVARVVTRKSQTDKLNGGEVLISEMTTPDYISAMKRASAIVTDEGGMTSHAAITARELEKPCIVGAEIATHVLEDGDKVEVNADEGVVKVID